MPLSATFGFFSPFHSKKKLIYQSFSPHFFSFFSLLLLISERPHSAPIFVMFLGGNFFQCCNKYNKCSEDFFDQSSLHHKYFIQNKLEL